MKAKEKERKRQARRQRREREKEKEECRKREVQTERFVRAFFYMPTGNNAENAEALQPYRRHLLEEKPPLSAAEREADERDKRALVEALKADRVEREKWRQQNASKKEKLKQTPMRNQQAIDPKQVKLKSQSYGISLNLRGIKRIEETRVGGMPCVSPFHPATMGELRREEVYDPPPEHGETWETYKSLALGNYRNNTENGDNRDNPTYPFPEDGSYRWCKKEGSEYLYFVKYTQGTNDKAWMEKKDHSYMARIRREWDAHHCSTRAKTPEERELNVTIKKGTYGLSNIENFKGYGPCPAVGSYLADGYDEYKKAALNDYRERRENGLKQDNPNENFPKDGSYTWTKEGCVDREHNDNNFCVKYTPGFDDKAWMEQKDSSYLKRLKYEKEEPKRIKAEQEQRRQQEKQKKMKEEEQKRLQEQKEQRQREEEAQRQEKFTQTLQQAERGNADAQFLLGSIYSDGLGVTKNMNESIVWYCLAAGQNHDLAKSKLNSLDSQYHRRISECRVASWNYYDAKQLFEKASQSVIAEQQVKFIKQASQKVTQALKIYYLYPQCCKLRDEIENTVIEIDKIKAEEKEKKQQERERQRQERENESQRRREQAAVRRREKEECIKREIPTTSDTKSADEERLARHYQAAVKLYTALIQNNAKNAEALYGRGLAQQAFAVEKAINALQRDHCLNRALQDLKAALEIDPMEMKYAEAYEMIKKLKAKWQSQPSEPISSPSCPVEDQQTTNQQGFLNQKQQQKQQAVTGGTLNADQSQSINDQFNRAKRLLREGVEYYKQPLQKGKALLTFKRSLRAFQMVLESSPKHLEAQQAVQGLNARISKLEKELMQAKSKPLGNTSSRLSVPQQRKRALSDPRNVEQQAEKILSQGAVKPGTTYIRSEKEFRQAKVKPLWGTKAQLFVPQRKGRPLSDLEKSRYQSVMPEVQAVTKPKVTASPHNKVLFRGKPKPHGKLNPQGKPKPWKPKPPSRKSRGKLLVPQQRNRAVSDPTLMMRQSESVASIAAKLATKY